MKLIKLDNKMAEFNFFINDKERSELIRLILSRGTKIVPDASYSTEEYLALLSEDDYNISKSRGECKFFLLDDSYTIEPIINSKNRFSSQPLYSIEQRKGGPYLDLIFYLGYAQDAVIPYKRSSLSYYDRFIHYDNNDEFKAPEPLKAYYKDLLQFIKSKCTIIKKNGISFWISKEVIPKISF